MLLVYILFYANNKSRMTEQKENNRSIWFTVASASAVTDKVFVRTKALGLNPAASA